jgi:1,4-dihydroxy-6-naphthoate synthase
VIRKDLGDETIARVSAVLRDSIAHALAHRGEVIDWLVAGETREGVPRDPALIDRYLAMYANADTLDYGVEGRRAITELLARGHAAGVIPHAVDVDFAP